MTLATVTYGNYLAAGKYLGATPNSVAEQGKDSYRKEWSLERQAWVMVSADSTDTHLDSELLLILSSYMNGALSGSLNSVDPFWPVPASKGDLPNRQRYQAVKAPLYSQSHGWGSQVGLLAVELPAEAAWVRHLKLLDAAGDYRSAVHWIVKSVEQKKHSRDYGQLALDMGQINPSDFSSELVLLALVRAVFSVRRQLKTWPSLLSVVRSELHRRNLDVKELLVGLD